MRKSQKYLSSTCDYIEKIESDDKEERFTLFPSDFVCPYCRNDRDMSTSCTSVKFSQESQNNLNLEEMSGGGKKTLSEPCFKNDLSIELLIEEIDKSFSDNKVINVDWGKMTLSSLIDHIVNYYHKRLFNDLKEFEPLLAKVLKAHGMKYAELHKINQVLVKFKEDDEIHMLKEESILFPAIKAFEVSGKFNACNGSINYPIAVMEDEHERMAQLIEAIKEFSYNYTTPSDAWGSYTKLYNKLKDIETELNEHVHKENNIFFKIALNKLSLNLNLF